MCNGHTNKAKCYFVPPEVLSKMAREGIEGTQLTIQQSHQTREHRKNIEIPPEKLETGMQNTLNADHLANGHSHRIVYDSQNQFSQRVNQVRSEGDPTTEDDSINHAYEYTGLVRDYFKNVFNRNSIDNQGLDIILNVHYGNKYLNAFWDGDEMTFGDGDGEIFISFAHSKDVIGHELSHGIVQYTANLVYKSQPGALNEHFADVFGTAIKQYSNNQTADDADWLIGNDIMGPKLFGEALRSMKAPGSAYDNKLMGKDQQVSHMKDYYSGSADNQGVHINSGIMNRAFYLVAMDIGTDKAVRVWYHALQNLWATANFNDAVHVIVRSAQILTKSGEVPFGTTQTIRGAFKEVGLS
ncbi:M4 family metallopeptidase [Bacillus inaquosorum]|uniref:M4 family metallopeptidase n=1 Tax=Bacillus inaquosorum TaxID=483913 RepID=UPI002282B3BA|nr:M4 family metallopeptidase [Bacillus inaquosorum]MCY7759729.1 M4 family metallopeptidase [Bacillus inaquosorum]MCY8731587.1 M4 family metallopeptidase [Bacillus inaquosorum]